MATQENTARPAGSPLEWREQAQIHLNLASEANARGHAGTWSREMHLAEMCMTQERQLLSENNTPE